MLLVGIHSWLHEIYLSYKMDLQLVPLHDHPKYTTACCDLLNDEWKRSEGARLHSLKQSCETLPTSLVLLKNNEVIGHAKLSKIPTKKEACFIESVVIARDLRRKGFGRILMEKTECYCKENLKLGTIYLSTHDKVEFYSKLGYKECPPVTMYGGSVVNFLGNYSSNTKVPVPKESHNKNVPVPPPLPTTQKVQPTKTRVFMKKEL